MFPGICSEIPFILKNKSIFLSAIISYNYITLQSCVSLEYYRKSDYIKGSNELVPQPYRISRIVGFTSKQDSLDSTSTTIKVSIHVYNV